MFYLFEKILGRPLSQKVQEGFFRIGLFLLFSLMFFVTFNDLKDLGLFYHKEYDFDRNIIKIKRDKNKRKPRLYNYIFVTKI